MGFLDTNARNPDITIAGITLALQFGNALPKYITGCKNITVVDSYKTTFTKHFIKMLRFLGMIDVVFVGNHFFLFTILIQD
jgi:hypothetical protein